MKELIKDLKEAHQKVMIEIKNKNARFRNLTPEQQKVERRLGLSKPAEKTELEKKFDNLLQRFNKLCEEMYNTGKCDTCLAQGDFELCPEEDRKAEIASMKSGGWPEEEY